eukprot:8623674-Pyramimonas_sp.AAC.1
MQNAFVWVSHPLLDGAVRRDGCIENATLSSFYSATVAHAARSRPRATPPWCRTARATTWGTPTRRLSSRRRPRSRSSTGSSSTTISTPTSS